MAEKKKYFRIKENTAFDVPPESALYESSRYLILPVPYEKTTTYGKGTEFGPEAIIKASRHVELYDEQFGCEPYLQGIHTMPYFRSEKEGGAFIDELMEKVHSKAADGKRVITLGGEHSLSLGPVLAYKKIYSGLTVIQFDAHADLREEYEGSRFNHACVMKRIHEAGCGIIQIGIRSMSVEEAPLVNTAGIKTLFAWQLKERSGCAAELVKKAMSGVGEDIYITFDVDAFDPSCFPATGTPEPGGLSWDEAISTLTEVIKGRNLVGFDIVETAPGREADFSGFTAAKLIYKIMGIAVNFP